MGQNHSVEWNQKCKQDNVPTLYLGDLALHMSEYMDGQRNMIYDFLSIPLSDRILVLNKLFDGDPCDTMVEQMYQVQPEQFWKAILLVLEEKPNPFLVRQGNAERLVIYNKELEINPDHIFGIAKYIHDHQNIRVCEITTLRMSKKNLVYMLNALRPLVHLKELTLSCNLRDDGVNLVANILRFFRSLETLDLRQNNITRYGCQILAETIQDHPTIHILGLFDNQNIKDGIKYLANILFHLTSLNVAKCGIDPEGTKAFAKKLRQRNCILQELDLHENGIGDDGAEALGKALVTNDSLQILDCSTTNTGERGVLGLFMGLLTNTTLKELQLRHCIYIKNNGAFIIGDALSRNISLQSLSINNCEMDDDGWIAICKGLLSNYNLKKITCTLQNFTNASIPDFAMLLKSNTGLQFIYTNYINLTEHDAIMILDALQQNYNITTFEIRPDFNPDYQFNYGTFRRRVSRIEERNTEQKILDRKRLASATFHDLVGDDVMQSVMTRVKRRNY